MENTSKNNYAKTCVLNVTADVKDGKNYVSDVYFTSPFKVMKPFHLNKNYMTVMMQTASAGILKAILKNLILISVTMQVWSSFPNPMKSFTKWMVAMLVETAPLK